MKHFLTMILAASTLTATTGTFASDVLLKKYNCVACHAADKKVVGPAYKDVAKKYAGNPTAEATLTKKVKAGGAGVWGPIPMPPHPQVPENDIQQLVKYILSLK